MAAEGAGCAGRRAIEEPVLSLPKEPLAFSVRQVRRQKKLELLRLRAAHTPPSRSSSTTARAALRSG